MDDTYQVRKDNLKPLYKEANIWSYEFQYFNINYHVDIQIMSTHLLCGGVNDDIGSSSVTPEVIGQQEDRSTLWECMFVFIFVGALMEWFFH